MTQWFHENDTPNGNGKSIAIMNGVNILKITKTLLLNLPNVYHDLICVTANYFDAWLDNEYVFNNKKMISMSGSSITLQTTSISDSTGYNFAIFIAAYI